MRDYKIEFEKRIQYVKDILKESKCSGLIFNNSGGKDCTLAGIICRAACENTISLIQPCSSKRNYGEDRSDALSMCEKYGIKCLEIDITEVKDKLLEAIGSSAEIKPLAAANIAPRLRMTTIYAFANSLNLLVAGTGNRDESYMGYFTKWGDGSYDFNPIADLSVAEIYDFLRYLNAPENIISKVPSAGLFDGQTDEGDMGVTYKEIDEFIRYGTGKPESVEIIKKYHERSENKRSMPSKYSEK